MLLGKSSGFSEKFFRRYEYVFMKIAEKKEKPENPCQSQLLENMTTCEGSLNEHLQWQADCDLQKTNLKMAT